MTASMAAVPPGTGPSGAERAYQGVLSGALLALGLFLPFSTAGVSLSMAVLLLLCLLAPRRLWATAPWRQPMLLVGLLLLAYIGLHTLAVSGVARVAGTEANHYHELLMLPLLWGLLHLSRKPRLLFLGFATGCVVYAGMHWAAPYVPKLAAWLGPRRISSGFALAVGAFLLYEHARLGLLPRRAAYAASAFLAATVLFANDGRTGHVVLLLLLGCVAWRSAPRRWRLATALAVLAASALVASFSSAVRTRLDETVRTAQAPGGPNQETSTAIRIRLLRNGAEVAADNYLLGRGWHNYADAYERVAIGNGDAPSVWRRADNPHNEYLMQLGGGGLPALTLFLAWIALPLYAALRPGTQDPRAAGMLACLALAFAVGSLFNSLLMDFTEGHIYAAMAAWLLAWRRQA